MCTNSLTHSQEYELATAKSTSTPYKMLIRLGNDLDWPEIKRKLVEMYSSIATEVHTASDLHHKQRPDETLQEYIQNCTNLTEKRMGTDPANITNRVVIINSGGAKEHKQKAPCIFCQYYPCLKGCVP